MTKYSPIFYRERTTGQLNSEKVYGHVWIELFYGTSSLSRILGRILMWFVSCIPIISKGYGWLQSRPSSRKKIVPFIIEFGVETKEFLLPTSEYKSFNDFFIRKLKPEARPIFAEQSRACIPADGRYLIYPRLDLIDHFIVKGQHFNLEKFLGDKELAEEFSKGSLVLSRLCPSDYHRFHIPVNGTIVSTKKIKGHLYSVNPTALKWKPSILAENKRVLSIIESPEFGKVIFVAIGATNVGSIQYTYPEGQELKKGDEIGYFEFGGSSLAILFLPKAITFDSDIIRYSENKEETRCLMGQSLGKSTMHYTNN